MSRLLLFSALNYFFFCTQLPFFCTVLPKNCISLSQSQSRNFFMYIITRYNQIYPFFFIFPLPSLFAQSLVQGHTYFWRDPFNQNSDRSDRENWSTSKGGPVFSRLFWLDRTDPLSFGPKFPEILVEWIARFASLLYLFE